MWRANVADGLTFLRAIVMRKNHSEEWKELKLRNRLNHAALWLTFVIRYFIATAAVYYILNFLSPFGGLGMLLPHCY